MGGLRVCVVLCKIIAGFQLDIIAGVPFFSELDHPRPVADFHAHIDNQVLPIHVLVDFFSLVEPTVVSVDFGLLFLLVVDFLDRSD